MQRLALRRYLSVSYPSRFRPPVHNLLRAPLFRLLSAMATPVATTQQVAQTALDAPHAGQKKPKKVKDQDTSAHPLEVLSPLLPRV